MVPNVNCIRVPLGVKTPNNTFSPTPHPILQPIFVIPQTWYGVNNYITTFNPTNSQSYSQNGVMTSNIVDKQYPNHFQIGFIKVFNAQWLTEPPFPCLYYHRYLLPLAWQVGPRLTCWVLMMNDHILPLLPNRSGDIIYSMEDKSHTSIMSGDAFTMHYPITPE